MIVTIGEFNMDNNMKKINLSEKQVVVLKSLLINEKEDLKTEIASVEAVTDKKGLQNELEACSDLLEQLK